MSEKKGNFTKKNLNHFSCRSRRRGGRYRWSAAAATASARRGGNGEGAELRAATQRAVAAESGEPETEEAAAAARTAAMTATREAAAAREKASEAEKLARHWAWYELKKRDSMSHDELVTLREKTKREARETAELEVTAEAERKRLESQALEEQRKKETYPIEGLHLQMGLPTESKREKDVQIGDPKPWQPTIETCESIKRDLQQQKDSFQDVKKVLEPAFLFYKKMKLTAHYSEGWRASDLSLKSEWALGRLGHPSALRIKALQVAQSDPHLLTEAEAPKWHTAFWPASHDWRLKSDIQHRWAADRNSRFWPEFKNQIQTLYRDIAIFINVFEYIIKDYNLKDLVQKGLEIYKGGRHGGGLYPDVEAPAAEEGAVEDEGEGEEGAVEAAAAEEEETAATHLQAAARGLTGRTEAQEKRRKAAEKAHEDEIHAAQSRLEEKWYEAYPDEDVPTRTKDPPHPPLLPLRQPDPTNLTAMKTSRQQWLVEGPHSHRIDNKYFASDGTNALLECQKMLAQFYKYSLDEHSRRKRLLLLPIIWLLNRVNNIDILKGEGLNDTLKSKKLLGDTRTERQAYWKELREDIEGVKFRIVQPTNIFRSQTEAALKQIGLAANDSLKLAQLARPLQMVGPPEDPPLRVIIRTPEEQDAWLQNKVNEVASGLNEKQKRYWLSSWKQDSGLDYGGARRTKRKTQQSKKIRKSRKTKKRKIRKSRKTKKRKIRKSRK